jgi:hypothetical protein
MSVRDYRLIECQHCQEYTWESDLVTVWKRQNGWFRFNIQGSKPWSVCGKCHKSLTAASVCPQRAKTDLQLAKETIKEAAHEAE